MKFGLALLYFGGVFFQLEIHILKITGNEFCIWETVGAIEINYSMLPLTGVIITQAKVANIYIKQHEAKH